ncbi:hypothetical protein JCM10450v2_002548 [Rhodotorula kratochvilovae]
MGAAQDIPYGFSPNSSAEFDEQFDPLKFEDNDYALDDDDLDEHGLFEQEQEPAESSGPGSLGKKKRANNRKGPQNADKRATHNAVERKRRESLNTRFIDLAKALPTTKHIKRPSKAVIVSKALDYVYDASAREHALTKENNELRCEVDQLRVRLGLPPLPPPAGLPEHRAATQPTLRKLRGESAAPPSVDPRTAEDSAPAPVLEAAPMPPTPPVESPSSASYLAAGSPTSSATSSSAPSALFDTTSPSLAAAASYSSFFSASSELGGSPVEAPLAVVGSSPLCQPMVAPTYFAAPPFDAQHQHQQHAAAAYAAAMNPALMHAHLAGLFPGAQAPQAHFGGGGAYLSPQLLLALQQQQQQQAHVHAQAFVPAPEWLTGLASPPQTAAGPTSMFASTF